MNLVTSDMISRIDSYAERCLDIPTVELMGRSADAVCAVAQELANRGDSIIILAGKGNNGGDGYAAAIRLSKNFRVKIYDVFSAGQRSDAGKFYMNKARYLGIEICEPSRFDSLRQDLMTADLVIDAVFGTGFAGKTPNFIIQISEILNESPARCLAVDIPIGINADTGEAEPFALRCDATVALSFGKPGIFSYPARDYVGKITVCDLGLDPDLLSREFAFKNYYTDHALACSLLPTRPENTSKGNFGKVLLIVGSDKYRGAAHLCLESSLRGGAGYTTCIGTDSLCAELRMRFPESIYVSSDNFGAVDEICALSSKQSATVIGCGSDCTEELYCLTAALIQTHGSALIVDADAINAISKYGSPDIFKQANRKIILTPHPLEMSRLCGISSDEINSKRLSISRDFAKKYGCILVLKGAATVITDGEYTYINGSGSSALAKAGSGDTLAGLMASLCACGNKSPLEMAALAVYIHGKAGDNLSDKLSDFGVTPSDLPLEFAKVIKSLK